ncbi:MAG: phosphotransferase family protein [Novosphingobium sp.]|nr:phosphotransferase family protein [Novosphingobium sp.]
MAGSDRMTDCPDFDLGRLETHLRSRLATKGCIDRIEPTSGGLSNPTFFLDFAGKRMVLRKQPPGPIMRSAHAIDREFRVLSALQGTGIPVPDVYLYEDDTGIIGTPFYLMEAVDGEVFQQASMPGLSPSQRHACYVSMAETMADLHRLDWVAIGLGDYGRPGNYFDRQFSRWSRFWREEAHRDNAALDELTTWLEEHPDAGEGMASLCHGDLKLNNFVFDTERGKVAAIIDWELSTIGHPFADAGFNCMAFHTTPQDYGGLRGIDLVELGIPDQRDYLEIYYARFGRAERMTAYHQAFAFFRAAVGSESVRHRAAQGLGVSDNSEELGARLGAMFAAKGLEIALAA